MRMIKLVIVTSVILILIPISCLATVIVDKTVFGIPLGEKFTTPECSKQKLGKTLVYKTFSDTVCFKRLSEKMQDTGPIINESVIISFSTKESPQIIKGFEILGLVMEGNLEGIGFNTTGISSADVVLGKLKEKYGRTTSFVPKKMTNRLGNSFDAFDATWDFDDLFVRFQSVTSSLDSGLVNIDTKKGKEHREKRLKELLKDKRPL